MPHTKESGLQLQEQGHTCTSEVMTMKIWMCFMYNFVIHGLLMKKKTSINMQLIMTTC
jgi:hypothetical protein